MNWEIMFPGKYIKSAELVGDVTVTIKSVTLEDLPEDKGGTKKRGVITFTDNPKALVCNRTNATVIKALFGAETDGWKGKRITLYAAQYTDPFTGEVGTATRIKGSPDMKDPVMEFTAKIGRKQANFKLVRTGKQPGPSVPGGLVNPAWTAIQKLWSKDLMPWADFGKLVADVTGKKGQGPLDANDVELVRAALQGPPPDSAPDAASEVAQ